MISELVIGCCIAYFLHHWGNSVSDAEDVKEDLKNLKEKLNSDIPR